MFDPAYLVRLAPATGRPAPRPERSIELPARVPLIAAIDNEIGTCRRYRCSLLVLRFGIDNLPEIEQRCGAFVEHQVLNLVWARLWTGVREHDVALHTGRGEFAVLIRDAASPVASLVAQRITALLGEPFRVDDLLIRLRVSAGHAVRMPDADADGAMLAALATQGAGGLADNRAS